ncbi:MAG: Mur ligase family protein, partial [Firmicutes bacterium]|nr:Mur ligase family protein [Bacillota bacterium]
MPQATNKPMIGVTGTNGKTTTILMLSFILEQCGLKPAVLDAWKGVASVERLLETAAIQDSDCLLLEVPIEALRRKQLDAKMFQCGALTNLSLDHLASCPTPDKYISYKAAFFTALPARAKAIINADDPKSLSLAQEGDVEYITYAAQYANAMIVANHIQLQPYGTRFDLTITADFIGLTNKLVSPGSSTVHLPVSGYHNVSNALLAASLALLFIPDIERVAQALSEFPGIRRNMEPMTFNHYRIIDDAARNPAAIKAALSSILLHKAKQVLLLHGIYGGGGPIINQYNALEIARWIQQNPHHQLFVTRSMYHCKSRHQVRMNEEKAFLGELKENNIDFAYYPDLP